VTLIEEKPRDTQTQAYAIWSSKDQVGKHNWEISKKTQPVPLESYKKEMKSP
jgi:hypothetical protein